MLLGYLEHKRCGSNRFPGQRSRLPAREESFRQAWAHTAQRSLAVPSHPDSWRAPRRQRAPATERESRVPLSVTLRYSPQPPTPREVALSELRARGKRSLFVDHPSGPIRPQEIIKHPPPHLPKVVRTRRLRRSRTARPQLLPLSSSPSAPFSVQSSPLPPHRQQRRWAG